MTLAQPAAPVFAPAGASSRPVWQTYGGGGLLAGGALLLIATVIEWVAYAAGAGDAVLLLAYGIAFVVALAVLVFATVALALGATGRDGVVGASVFGRVALIGYGIAFLASQGALLFGTFALDGADADAARTLSFVLSVIQSTAGVFAAVVVARSGVARGFARWGFGVSVLVGVVAGVLASAGISLSVTMGGFCVSAISLAIAGLAFTRSTAGARRSTAGTGTGFGETASARGW
jgi:hypothetical protein